MVTSRNVATLPLAELVEDLSVYPRHAVDDSHVAQLVQAIEAGCELPPVIACKKTKRVADGWHRLRAHRRVYGPTAVVAVELREYGSEAELLEDAVRLNAAHGRRLDAVDRVRAAVMLERAGLPEKRIALVLHVTPAKLQTLRVKVATAPVKSGLTIPGTRTVVLKRPVQHLAGTRLTEEQVLAHDLAPGTSYLLIVRQLAAAVETGLVNRADERLVEALRGLRKLLQANGY